MKNRNLLKSFSLYLKKHLRVLALVFIGFFGIVSRANAFDLAAGTYYYDNSQTQWSAVHLFIGHTSYVRSYSMTNLGNGLYSVTMSAWGGATAIFFANGNGGVSGGNGSVNINTAAGSFPTPLTGKTANNTNTPTAGWYYIPSANTPATAIPGAWSSTAPSTSPALTTTAATGINKTSGMLNGNISANGGASITDYGFYYSTTNGFANGTGTKLQKGTSNYIGNFSFQLTGLISGTPYYFKAYATNSVGTTYGAQQSFTPSTPLFVTDVLANNKISFYIGEITSWNPTTMYANTGDRTGLVGSTTMSSTVNINAVSCKYGAVCIPAAQYYITHDATGWTGIRMASTAQAGKYYVVGNNNSVCSGGTGNHLCVIDGAQFGYAYFDNNTSTTTKSIPVGTTSVTLSSQTGATYYQSPVGSAMHFEYYIANGTDYDLIAATSDITSAASQVSTTYNTSSLAAGTYNIYTLLTDGIIYIKSETTLVLTVTSTNPMLTASSLTGFGNQCLNSTAGPNSFTISGTLLTSDNVTVGSLPGYTYCTTSDGTYTSSLSLSQPGGTYSQPIYVKFTPTAVQSYNGNIVVGGGGASSINIAATGSGINSPPTVTTPTFASITTTTATLGGNMTALGCTNATEQGIYYSTTYGFADGDGTKVSATGLNVSTPGIFTQAVTGLTTGTTFYFKAFATNSGGTGYSAQGTFATLATAPAAQPTTLTFSGITASAITANWTAASGPPTGYIVLYSSSTAPNTDPVPGTTYTVGSTLGNAKVAYVGSNLTTGSLSSLTAGTTYYFKVYSYNGSGSSINYLTTAPLAGSQATLTQQENHTIILDGNLTDWYSNEQIFNNGNIVYLAWDATYIYVAFQNGYNTGDKLNVAFDINPGTNDVTGGSFTTSFAGLTFSGYLTPDYIVQSTGNTNLGVFTRSETGWGSPTSIYSGSNLYRSGSIAEIRIPRSNIGMSDNSKPFGLYAWLASGVDNAYSVFGTDNPVNISGGRMRTALVWPSSGNGAVVNASYSVDHNNSETRPMGVTTGIRNIYVSNGTGTTASGMTSITGNVTVASGGNLTLGANLSLSSVTLAGGTLTSGGKTLTASGTLQLTENSTIALTSASHTLTFANSSSSSWTTGKTLTVTGWTGTAGSTGTNGKIKVGNDATGLTATQLTQISFSGSTIVSTILNDGEVVPQAVLYYKSVQDGDWSSASTWNKSTDNTNWVAATIAPTSADVVTISTGNTVTISAATTTPASAYFNVNGIMQINSGGYVTTSPTYSSTSTLIYNSSYNTSSEWSGSTTVVGVGIPQNIIIQNGATVTLSDARGLAGNLSLGATGSAGNLSLGTSSGALKVGGNVSIGSDAGTSTLTLSSVIGGDIYVGGNWTRNANGAITNSSRAVFFTGTGTQEVSVPGTFNFDYIVLNKTAGSVKMLCDVSCEGPNGGHAITLTGSSDILDLNGYTLTLGKTGVVSDITGTGYIKGSSLSSISIIGDGALGTLNFYTGYQTLNNLTINRASTGTLTLGTDLTVYGAFTLTDGTLSVTSGKTLTLSSVSTTPQSQCTSFIPISVNASGTGLTFQWYSNGSASSSGGTSLGASNGAQTNTYTPQTSDGSKYYYCKIAGTASATSNVSGLFTVAGNSWVGGTEGNWEVDGNWSCGTQPTTSTDVSIPTGSTVHITSAPTSPANCRDLTISSGAKLIIDAGKALTVSGTLTNSATALGLVIKSDASLIHSTAGVQATVERYITGDWSAWNSGWHQVSSPVSGQAISAFVTTGSGGYDFYGWDEPSNTWMNYKADDFSTWNGGTNMNKGDGYLISFQTTQTDKSFSGNLNVEGISKTYLSKTGTQQYSAFHLLGNPFASAVKWNDGNWDLTDVGGVAKTWNAANKSYSDIAAESYIPACQGFMIEVGSASNSITIPAASREHNTTPWYKSADANQKILLEVSESVGKSAQESQVLVNALATDGFDFNFDSHFLPGYAPQFYSKAGNEMLSTNTMPSLPLESSIPFGFVKNFATNFSIRLKESIEGYTIYLKDLKTNTDQNLSDNPVYNFTSAQGDNPDRFLLHFLNTTATTKPAATQPLTVYYAYGKLYLNGVEGKAEIYVRNAIGQVIMHKKVSGSTLQSLDASLPAGVYIVSVVTGTKIVSGKVVVSK